MSKKPVDRNIAVIVGPIISGVDFSTPVDNLAFDATGLEIVVILETATGSTTHTIVVPTNGSGVYDWSPKTQGYYELELPASGGSSFNNTEEGLISIVGKADGVLAFRSIKYEIVPQYLYDIYTTDQNPHTSLCGSDPLTSCAYYYGSVLEANEYFALRLHERAWTGANVEDRPKALWASTLIIDALNYKGNKSTVYTLLEGSSSASDEEIREAEAAQPLEFPRGADIIVPEVIRRATYEIAHDLLDGKDPEIELENLGIISQSYAAVKTTYSRNQVPIEHIINGIPSTQAWRWIRPFLREDDAILLSRIS